MNKKVAIVILNYLGYKDTINCIRSIVNQNYNNCKVFIVDNCSPNNSVSEISSYCTNNDISIDIVNESDIKNIDLTNKVSIISAKENLGYAHGNNIALKYAISLNEFEYYWILNNDTEVEPDTLKLMVNEKINDRYNRPVGNFIYYYDKKSVMQMAGGLTIDWRFFKTDFSQNESIIDYLGGASYLIDNMFIEKYGLMYEEYFLNSEDLEYFYVYKRDFKLKHKDVSPFIVTGVIYHKESATQGKYSPLSQYYYTRNIFYSCKKLGRSSMPGLILFTMYRFIKWSFIDRAMAKSIIMAVRDYRKGILGKVNYFDKKQEKVN